MTAPAVPIDPPPTLAPHHRWDRAIAATTIVVALLAIAATLSFALTASRANLTSSTTTTAGPLPKAKDPLYPVGVADASMPSGLAPPGVAALAGYSRSYVEVFDGSALPAGWSVFTGVPGGDPGGKFAASHVVMRGGLLTLNAWQDPRYGDRWVTGGLCQCGLGRTYGAYFVRSRITGAGPDEVELLWPLSNTWPPEIDFNETGPRAVSTGWTVHFDANDDIIQRAVKINMTKWHTFGLIWTPTSITFVVDSIVWGRVTTPVAIPHVPMTLDFEQRALCTLGRDCPQRPETMQVNWVAEYAPR